MPAIDVNDPRLTAALLAQGQHPWGDRHIGASSATIASKGCALTALCSIARFLGSDLSVTPEQANTYAMRAGALAGANLFPMKLAPALGLVAGPKLSMDDDGSTVTTHDLFVAIGEAFDVGGCALVCVDTDAGRPGTSAKGNHYVAAVGMTDEDEPRVVCVDPAGGQVVLLDAPALTCLAPPRRPRAYKARSVRPVRRAP